MSKKQKSKTLAPASCARCVCMEFNHPCANEVCVAGTFNDWHPTATPLNRDGDGRWTKELTLAPGRYEYRLLADGQWIDDPAAKETVPNPFGGFNAVLIVQPTS